MSSNFSRFVSVAVLISFSWIGASAAADRPKGASPFAVDRIAAVVNDEVITLEELNDQVRTVTKQLKEQGTPLPAPDVLQRQMLERMITQRAELQYARETGIRVEDTQLDQTLLRIADDNKMTLQQMREELEKDEISFKKFREEIRDQIIMSRVKEREVDNRIVVTDGEVDNYLRTRALQHGSDAEFNLSHILIRVPEQASPEQIQARRQRAAQVLAQLKSGADFAQVSAGFSDAPDALQGGNLGWRPADRVPSLFLDAAVALQPGEVSPVLRSPNGFHIIKLIGKRESSGVAMVTQTLARHILIKTNELVSETDARNRLDQLRERIDNGADFAELARLHSEDASASKGGDLGWLSPGDTVPEFEHAMDALKPGDVSRPVKTPFGWHLIQVLQRRSEDVSKERQLMQARQAIRAQKVDEAYQEWLRQLRDNAYVEYRLEEK